MEKTYRGSCLCGEVKFEFKNEPFSFSLCHCKMCRKFSGGAFGSFMGVKKDDFTYTHGAELVEEFKSSDWASRTFCKQCGSSLMYLYAETPENYFVSAGVLDEEIALRPKRHIFVKDKSDWYEIADSIPQVERF